MKFIVAVILIASMAFAMPVSQSQARMTVEMKLESEGQQHLTVENAFPLEAPSCSGPVAYVFELGPEGYVITSSDDGLPPIIAYSFSGDCRLGNEERGVLLDFVTMDMEQRVLCLDHLPQWYRDRNRDQWNDCFSGVPAPPTLQQWPPAGTTPTEGWLMENWTQGSPYNMYCPMDNIAGSRSVAGCPAVAMGSILNYRQETNSTRFTDDDDYYHNYHEYYWIDDDHVAHDFPSWDQLNTLLDTLDAHYSGVGHVTDSDRGTIVYASGAACRQVYTASVSGTFGVGQAYDAYLKFGFSGCQLIEEESDTLYSQLAANMMNGMPAHLAIVDAAIQYGHNLVIDGYNTDEFFHLNFGWGGGYNGWYQFPLSGMPYSMDVIEGVILDIGGPLNIEDPGYPQASQDPVQILSVTNPASSNVEVDFLVTGSDPVRIDIYSIDGRLAGTAASGVFSSGEHTCTFSMSGLPEAVYVVRAACGRCGDAVRFTLIR